MSSSKSLSSLSGGEGTFLSNQEFSSLEPHDMLDAGSDALVLQPSRAESRWRWRLGAVLAGAAASGAMPADRSSFWTKVPMVTSLVAAALASGYAYLVISRLLERRDARRFEVIAQLSFKELGDAAAGIVRVLGCLIRCNEPPEVAFQSGRFDLGPRLSALVRDPRWLSHAYQRVGILRRATRSVAPEWGSLLQSSRAGFGLLTDYAQLLVAISLLRRVLDDWRNERGEPSERHKKLCEVWERIDRNARGLANALWARAESRQRFLEPSLIPADGNRPVFNSVLLPDGAAAPERGFTMTWLDWTVSVLAIAVPFGVGVWMLANT
jgi:hypothetical protein